MSYCSEKAANHKNSQSHIHSYKPSCSNGQFNDGYYSHIRGTGSGVAHRTHIFPGIHPFIGGERPIYLSNPDVGNVIIIKNVHDGRGPYAVYPR